MCRTWLVVMIVAGSIPLSSGQARGQEGAKIFEGKGNCWTCHGRQGRGTPLAPDLTDGVWLNVDGSLDSIRAVIRTGVAKPKRYPAPMPAMGGARLNQAEIDALARYVLLLADTTRPSHDRRLFFELACQVRR